MNLTVVVFWTFFCLTGVALILLRERDPDTPRPFRVPGYPILPIIFCATCGYMLYASTAYAGKMALIPAVLVLSGLLICGFSRRRPTHEEKIGKIPVRLS